MQITPIDKEKEEGVWFDYYGVELKIRRVNYNSVLKKIREKTKGKGVGARVDIDSPVAIEAAIEVLAENVLVDWKNFYIDAVEIPYSVETCKQLLENDVDCRDFVSTISRDIENYLEDDYNIVGE